MSDAAKKSLVKKLAEVMGEVERIPKSGRNEFHRYDYATEADIVASVRKGMAERGVVLVPSIQKCEWSERQAKSGAVKIATLSVHFTFMDGDSPEKIEFDGMGQGEDASDKAIYKAMTGAEKYALLKFFLIPTGDDPEADAKRHPAQAPANGHAAAVKQQLKAPPPAPKPRLQVVDVKPGETEAEATARTRQQVAGETTLERQAREEREKAAAKTDESIQAMLELSLLQKQLAWTGQKMASVIKGATGKSDRSKLVLADVATVKAAISSTMGPLSTEDASPSEAVVEGQPF